jgi:GT2 family glycosyltransferase
MRLSQDFVRQQVEFMDSNPKVGIGKGMYGHGVDHKTVAVLENMEFLIDFKAKGLTNTKSLGTSGCIYRLEALHEINGFDINITGAGEDMDAEYRIRERGWELFVTDAVFYEKRRDTWRSLWDEYYWHGCGLQPLLDKSSDRVNIVKIIPPIAILQELMRIPQAYKLTKQRVAILLPAHYVYKRIAWILGFIASRKSKKSVK